ncbi:MAG: STELLO glycosyltransferase family protein [Cyanobacteria bacterium J06634_6]
MEIANQMKDKFSIVITSINPPTEAVLEIAKNVRSDSCDFIVIGDSKSPADFKAESCLFYSVEDQLKTDFSFASKCPTGHYARKNVGYLIAIANKSSAIVETDDDNIPLRKFWQPRRSRLSSHQIHKKGWVNVYKYFSDALIWPRGLPLSEIHSPVPALANTPVQDVYCPIQQGLANENPDVDAIYRLVLPLPFDFKDDVQVSLMGGAWCPFNSQNTTWFPDAYPLLYLPAYCSFRMTDIWRSFVAQRIAWANDWSVLFHEATVYQKRNEHNLMKDFDDEVVGYLNNEKICNVLGSLPLEPGVKNIPANMISCYEALVELDVVGKEEIELLKAWLEDLSTAHNQN